MKHALLFLALAGCASSRAAEPASSEPTESAPALPFIEDDFPRAISLARQSQKPLFVDVWAPW